MNEGEQGHIMTETVALGKFSSKFQHCQNFEAAVEEVRGNEIKSGHTVRQDLKRHHIPLFIVNFKI